MIRYRFGRWGSDVEGASSNFRELLNLVETLETMAKTEELSGAEVFLFTDNSTAEAAFHRGSSSSKRLHTLVRKLKLLEMVFIMRLHVVHVAGKRMIEQGTDGLSRGCLTDGVMIGREMSSFIPLHEDALSRSGDLWTWLQRGAGDDVLELLRPEGWFERGHDMAGGKVNCDGTWVPVYKWGNFIWSPPPCVAGQCIEELRKARHKRQQSTHIFVCPKVMASVWQRHLYRSADLVIHIPAGHQAWSTSQHESLLLGFYFPFLLHEPWQLKGSNTILGMARRLQQVCKTDSSASGLVLRELWQFTRKLPNLPELVVRRMLHGAEHHTISKTTTRKR